MTKNDSLVSVQSQEIALIENSIQITNKIVFNGIEGPFNEAFILLNSKDKIDENVNYCFLLEYDNSKLKEFKNYASRKEDYCRVLQLLNQVIKIKHINFLAYYLKAVAFFRLDNYEKTIDCCEKSINLNQKFAIAYHLLGNAKIRLQQFNEALQAFDTAIELCDDFAIAYNDRSFLKWVHFKDRSGAEKDIENFNKYHKPNNAD